MPEFVNLTTTVATTRPEVDYARATAYTELEADVGEQVMVTVESHEMIDIEDGDGELDGDTKWGPDETQTQSSGRLSARKVRDMV